MKMMINDLVYARGVNAPLRQAVLMMQAEMATLTAKLADTEAEAMKYKLATSKNADALRESQQQLAEAQRDAERYRWLRQQEVWEPARDALPTWYGGRIKWLGGSYSCNEIDAIIDAAMARSAE